MSLQTGESSSRTIPVITALFIIGYFLLFSYHGLTAWLSFDDGMNFITIHHQWEVPLSRNVFDALQVFTSEQRPLGALFYRPLYHFFGFNPLPYRIAIYILLMVNIGLAYLFARALGASREASALSTLLFSYNASLMDLYYNTGTIYDIFCFSLYIGALTLYIRESSARRLRFSMMLVVLLLYLAALDAKEMAVIFPVALMLYELLYHNDDFQNRKLCVRVGGFIFAAAMIAGAYLRVKVASMSREPFYQPRVSPEFVLKGMEHYIEQFLYLHDGSLGMTRVVAGIVFLVSAGVVLRSRTAVYGTLFFVGGLLPVAAIAPRGAYAAYIALPGLTIAVGTILALLRMSLARLAGEHRFERGTAIALFISVAVGSIAAFAAYRREGMANMLWSGQRVIEMLKAFKRTIPEFPPDARVLILKDPWGPDWGPMFLLRLLYRDRGLWVDRLNNPEKPGPRESYDLLVTYNEPYIDLPFARFLGIPMKWEIRAVSSVAGSLTLSAPEEARAARNICFSPAAIGTGHPVAMIVPGLRNTKVDAVYRIISNRKSTVHVESSWCTLDEKGSCTITAPAAGPVGMLVVDWLRGAGQRWIFTNGVLTVVE